MRPAFHWQIAQALLGNPRLIIVDEPTAGLNREERAGFKPSAECDWTKHHGDPLDPYRRLMLVIELVRAGGQTEPSPLPCPAGNGLNPLGD